MKAGRFLFFVLLGSSCCLPAWAFQISPIGATRKTAQANLQTRQDDLDLHRSAAETYQLSGDLERAGTENRMVVALGLVRLADAAAKRGDRKRTSELLLESIAANDSIQARTALSSLYLQSGNFDQGIEHARAAVNIGPESGEAHEALGKLLYLKGDYAAALAPLERVLTLKPNFDAAYALGVTYLQLKQAERAKLLFEELLSGVGNKAFLHLLFGKAYYDTNYPTEAEREFRKAIQINPKLPRAHFYLGYLILQDGGSERLAEAGKAFEAELRFSPNDPYSHFFVGVVASTENDHPKAIRFLQEAIRLNPTIGTAYLFLGQSQAELGENIPAEKNLRKAIELTKDSSKNNFEIRRAHFLLGRLLIKLGRKQEGEKELATARALQGRLLESTRDEVRKIIGEVDVRHGGADPKDSLFRTESSVKSSLSPQESAKLTALENQLKEIVAQAYHNLAVAAVQTGRIDESLEKFAAAHKWKADFPGLDRNWGIVAFTAKQFEGAVGPLSRHIKKQPQDSLARRMLGVSYYFTKKFDLAVATLKPIEPTIASDPELAYFYGMSLSHLQRHKEAAVVFARIAEQNQKSAEARFYAGQGLVITGDLAKAVAEFRAAATLDPARLQAHYNAGQTLIRMNRLDEADTEFRKELERNAGDELSKYHLAYTLLERKAGTDEAIRLLREAISSKYDYADARYQLGKALIEKGEISEAIDQLQTAANLEPGKDYIRYQLSIAYRRASRLEDADRELKLYRELKAKNRSDNPPGMGTSKDVP